MKINIKRKIEKQTSPEEIVDFLLKDRGIKDREGFFNPPHPTNIKFAHFFEDTKKYKKDFEKTLKLLKDIKEKGDMIVVYTDYDADGITGGAVLWETLHKLGFNAMPYVPHRKREGYGFSRAGLDSTKKQFDPALIISVDHGIVAHDKIAYAAALGMPIIVTDHHQRSKTDPKDAFAVFHTDQLSGSGVAYFFAKELFSSMKQSTINNQQLERNFISDYLALSSIGTIADMVPLLGPARSVAKHGLHAFSKTTRAGIRHILKEAQIVGRTITPYEVGFIIAPRINAFGRLEHALDALRLLCTAKEDRARVLASVAGKTNRLRQELVKEAIEEAEQMVNGDSKIIVLHSDSWEEGIIGLIASRLVEKFYRPAIVMTRSDGFAKASARSISGFDITSFLRSLSDLLVDVGGHKAAAGFTIEEENIDAFIGQATDQGHKLLKDEDLVPKLDVDLAVPLTCVTLWVASALERLQPFGVGNPKPLFYSEGRVVDAKLLGKNGDHLKLYLRDASSLPVEFVFFGKGPEFFNLSRGQRVSVVYSLEVDRWGGRERVVGKGKYISQALE